MARKAKALDFDPTAIAASAAPTPEMPKGTRQVESSNPFIPKIEESWDKGSRTADEKWVGSPSVTDWFPRGELKEKQQKQGGETVTVSVYTNEEVVRNMLRAAASHLNVGVKTRVEASEDETQARVYFQALEKRAYTRKETADQNGETEGADEYAGE